MHIFALTPIMLSALTSGSTHFAPSSTIYEGGSILTMVGSKPTYAEALVVTNGKIAYVGTKSGARAAAGAKPKVVDLRSKTLLPGFIDGHSHYINSLLVANQCKLYAPPSGPGKDVPSIIAELKRYAAERKVKKGEMIIGYGYDDTVMPGGRLLNRDDLDQAFPNNPVRIDHVSMHGAVLNSLAQKMYGFSAATKTPPGGVIVRKPGTQEPYGLIMETAFMPVIEKQEPMTAKQEIEWSRAGQLLYAQSGVTTAHEGATHFAQYQTLKRAADAGANVIDIVTFPFITDLEKFVAAVPKNQWTKYSNRLKIGGVKITFDGSPQGRTAFFTTPYLLGGPSGEKNWKGEPTFPEDLSIKMVKQVYDMKVPLLVHCNGDASIDLFLKAYEAARAGDYSKPWNVTTIHTQFLRKDQIPKYVKYKIRPSIYTLHTYYFADAHIANRGIDQAAYISPARDIVNAGLRPTNHTDFVVAPLDQMMMLWSAVNRRSRSGIEIGSDQRVTPYEGLKMMTAWAAEQYDEQDRKGTLEVGKLADFVILNQDPNKVDPDKIKDIKVLSTIKEGKTIFPADPNAKVTIPAAAANSKKTYSIKREVCDIVDVNAAAGKWWSLSSLGGKFISKSNPPRLKFANGKVMIKGGVNTLTASYAILDDTVFLGDVASTKMAGDPAAMKLERDLAATLKTVDSYKIEGKTLILLDNGKPVAVFRDPVPAN